MRHIDTDTMTRAQQTETLSRELAARGYCSAHVFHYGQQVAREMGLTNYDLHEAQHQMEGRAIATWMQRRRDQQDA